MGAPSLSLLLLALSSKIPGNDANRKVMKDVASCFKNNEDNADIAKCLAGISSCFDEETTVDEIQACIEESSNEIRDNRNTTATRGRQRGGRLLEAPGNRRRPGSFEGFEESSPQANRRGQIARKCLMPYTQCVREEIRGFVESLPECLKTSARALGMCYRENAASCNATCSLEDIPTSNPFKGVGSPASIAFCGGFQKNIMDPSCAIVGCCAECTGEFEGLMNCVAQEVGDLKPSPCELECPDAGDADRRLAHGRRLAEEDGGTAALIAESSISEECLTYLDTKEDVMTLEGINQKLLEGEFITCVQDAGLSIVADDAAVGSTSAGSRVSVLAANLALVLVGALLFA